MASDILTRMVNVQCALYILIVQIQWNIYIYIHIIFTNPSARAGYDTRSIFKWSLTGFEFRVFLLID